MIQSLNRRDFHTRMTEIHRWNMEPNCSRIGQIEKQNVRLNQFGDTQVNASDDPLPFLGPQFFLESEDVQT